MAFLDNTGLSHFWQHVLALAAGLTPKSRKINGKSLDADITITAADLGLEQAMKFLGTSGIAISDGDTDPNITVGGQAVVAELGNVVLYGGKEYVFSSSGWEELGDEGSHALKSITITAGAGLTGGGDLSANRTINVGQGSGILVETDKVSHADTSSVANVTAANRTYVKSLTFDGFGHVTGVTTGTETVVDTDTGATSITTTGSGNAVTAASYDAATRKITLTKDASYVPTSRTVNGKALSSNITLSAGDVSAYTKAEIDEMVFITTDDIDTICGASIVAAASTTF